MPDTLANASHDPTQSQDNATLCTACGMCCTGALHDNAVLEPEEVEAARAIGLPVGPPDLLGFTLPCPKLAGTICSIYEDRPRVCSRYKCRLLLDVESGVLPLSDGLRHVRDAKALAAKVLAALPAGVTFPAARAATLTSLRSAGSASPVTIGAEALLHHTALLFYIDRHFRNAKDGRMLQLDAAAGDQS